MEGLVTVHLVNLEFMIVLITLTGLSAVIGLGSSYTIQELSRFFLL